MGKSSLVSSVVVVVLLFGLVAGDLGSLVSGNKIKSLSSSPRADLSFSSVHLRPGLLFHHYHQDPVHLPASIIAIAHQPARLLLPVGAGGAINKRPTRMVLHIVTSDGFQEGSPAPTVDNMVVVFCAEPSPSSCATTRCKKARLSSTTTTPMLPDSTACNHGASSTRSFSKLRCFWSSAYTSPELLLAGGLVEDRRPACWLEQWLGSSCILCTRALPLHQFRCCEPILSLGRCLWVPSELLSWRRGCKLSTSNGCLCSQGRVGIRVSHADGCSSSFNPGSHIEKGTRYKLFLLCTLRASKHGSGKATLCVRADLRLRSMLVLRFNVKNSGVNFLSPVKAIRYLRLKIPNPHRHRPVRQSRGAPTVLSECNKEDPRCLWCGHPSSTAQRPRRRHHLCLLLEKCIVQVFRPSDALQAVFFYLSHCFGFAVVAQKLRLCLGWKIPNLCTLVLSA